MKDEGKQKAKNLEIGVNRQNSSFPFFCPACGAHTSGSAVRFCNVCGKLLSEEYQPLDNWRSSYRMQGKPFKSQTKTPDTTHLFEQNKNAAAQTAWACFVYSLVPYLGILFVPLTFSISGFGYFAAVRRPFPGGRTLSLASFYLSFVVLAIQLFLWWLLYSVPKMPVF